VGVVDSLTGLFLLWLVGILFLFLFLIALARGRRSLNIDFKLLGAELKINAAMPGDDKPEVEVAQG